MTLGIALLGSTGSIGKSALGLADGMFRLGTGPQGA